MLVILVDFSIPLFLGRVIVHVIDMAGLDGRCPYQEFLDITEELKKFNAKMLERPQVIVANKMDLPSAKENIVELNFFNSSVISKKS